MEATSKFIMILACVIEIIDSSKFDLYFTRKANWYHAGELCQLNDRGFAKVNSEKDQQSVQMLLPYVQGFFWIGLKWKVAANQFVWSDSSVLDYANWAEGFPGTTDGLDCVRIRHFDFKWETFNCSGELNYLCEDTYQREPYVVTQETKIKGFALGIGLVGGLVVLCCLLLQLPCCRIGDRKRYQVIDSAHDVATGKDQVKGF